MPAPHPFSYVRRVTRAVAVGDVGVGGTNPIRVQSMTTPATTDVAATIDQIERLVAVGCEIVRVTVPSKADADCLPAIRAGLRQRGINVPLVADIHFTPAAAMLAVEHVEKIRINPGNFADKKHFLSRDYTDGEYADELERIRDRFVPLVRRARELGVSMRIGTNHGSLSDRIMNRFGDTANGMVESALEFVRIAADEGYHELILSMKSSNPLVAIEAYRLLVRRMDREGMAYPLHLGVTEAGDGEDARIKSAVGIGALLEEGLGDTVRVSLTEDPEAEIPVAFALVAPYNARLGRTDAGLVPTLANCPVERPRELAAGRRPTRPVGGRGAIGNRGTVLTEVRLRTPLATTDPLHHEIAAVAGYLLAAEKKAEWLLLDVRSAAEADAVVELARLFATHGVEVPLAARVTVAAAADEILAVLLPNVARVSILPAAGLDQPAWTAAMQRIARAAATAGVPVLIEPTAADVPTFIGAHLPSPDFEGPIETAVRAVAILRAHGAEAIAACWTLADPGPTAAVRLLIARLDAASLDVPVLGIDCGRDDLLAPSIHLGALLADGLLDAVRIESGLGARRDLTFAYDLLQATRQRIVKTEFIACPSCGRTLFDLQLTTQRIRQRTGHLKGLKIAIMGCIVNGPGEMADADFGYVGWGRGLIALFAGKEMVMKDVPAAEAGERLVELIRAEGRWIDPPP